MLDENLNITFDAEVEKIFQARPTFLALWCSLLFCAILMLISVLLFGFSFSQKQTFQVRLDLRENADELEIPIMKKFDNLIIMLNTDSPQENIHLLNKQQNLELSIRGGADVFQVIKKNIRKNNLKILIDKSKEGSLGWQNGNEIKLKPIPTADLTKFEATISPQAYKLLEQCFYASVKTDLQIEFKERNFYAYIFKNK